MGVYNSRVEWKPYPMHKPDDWVRACLVSIDGVSYLGVWQPVRQIFCNADGVRIADDRIQGWAHIPSPPQIWKDR